MKLGRYEVVRELGKGAMGIVYLAKDPLIGRLVALKTIRPSSNDDDEAKEFQERFVREAQAAGILNHPNIVTVHDIGQDPESGISFIAMEYIEGLNLKEILQQGKGMHFFEVGEIVAQVAEALDYAHSKGIIHRDVKPANIILPTQSKAKITDFGIAKIASSVANLTTTGQFLGTPNYMAPEQIKGSRIDGRSDLFSLGIVFYECLARRKPFGGDSLTTISYKIVHEPFPPLNEIDSTIPEGFEEIVGRCLAKDPAGRYQRGQDMAQDIRAVIRGEGVTRPVDLSAFEETLMSRDAGEKIPTVEIPFPEADSTGTALGDPDPADGPLAATLEGSAPPAAKSAQPPASKIARPPSTGLAMKRRISAPAFFGLVAMVLIPLAVWIAAIIQQKVTVPVVDQRREAVTAKQRSLRNEAEKMMQAHNYGGAYERYLELQRLAPNSPVVNSRIHELQQIRSAQLTVQQQLAQATATFEQGKQLYEAKDYTGAIPLFEEAFHLNPNLGEAVNFLKMSREQLALKQQTEAGERVAVTAQQSRQAQTQARGVLPITAQHIAAKTPATLITSFKSPVNDGYLLVKVNGQTLIYENLWEERRGLFRRKVPRDILISKEVASDNLDVEVWVIVPSLKMQEHRQFRQVFPPGGQRKLTLSLNPDTNKLDIQWS